MEANEQKVIYSLWVMRQLFERGFQPIEVRTNPLDEKYKCWVFARTAEFDAALDQVLGGVANGRK